MKTNAKELFHYTKQKLASIIFHFEHKTLPKYFTRESVLGFENTALLILNMIKKSIKVELMNFFYQVDKQVPAPSRQAFSEAREKISFNAFKDFFEKSCELALNSDGARLCKGYRLFGVDGTSFIVGPLSKLADYFGESTTVKNKAMCRISGIVDVLNDCIVDALVSPFRIGERALAIEQIKKLKPVSNALFLLDRGYWSPVLTKEIIKNGQKFLMRLASNTGKTIVTDENGGPYPLRRLSFILPSGETEVLLTNLTADEFSDNELFVLYAKRWGIETKYLELKDRLQIDKFSGGSVNIILQDIYATLYISNLSAFICFEADEAIKERTADKRNKYEQKTNRSTCISTLRRRFIDICLINDAALMEAALQRLYDDISKDVIYINKSKPRTRNKRQLKDSRRHNKSSIL